MRSPFFQNVALLETVLFVESIERLLTFYCDTLGLRIITKSRDRAELSATGKSPPLLILEVRPKAPPRLDGSSGLFHIAFLYPDREALAGALRRLLRQRYPLQGASDHGVSEAIYLADPEHNGIELYADRSPSVWPRAGDGVNMVTNALDLENLLSMGTSSMNDELPPDTVIGHMHLNVTDLTLADNIISKQLAMPVRQRNYKGALFFGYDGYHHHIAANTWGIRSPAQAGSLGLQSFKLCRLGAAAVQQNLSVVQLDNVQIHFATDDRLPSG